VRIPAKKISNTAPLSAEETELRAELIADVRVLAGEIGERNMARYRQLIGASAFIEDSFSRAGLQPCRDSYELHGRACHNIETEIRGIRPEILLIGGRPTTIYQYCPRILTRFRMYAAPFAAMLRRGCRSTDFGDGKSLDFYLAEHFDQRLIGCAVAVVVANCPAL
jgi:hypothetical protein